MKIRKIKKQNKGSLLIEAILAVVILGTSLTVIIQSLSSAVRANVVTFEYLTATTLLENKMFGLIKDGFIKRNIKEEQPFMEPFEKYRGLIETKEAASVPKPSQLNEVNLNVSWDSGRRTNVLSVITYLFTQPDEK